MPQKKEKNTFSNRHRKAQELQKEPLCTEQPPAARVCCCAPASWPVCLTEELRSPTDGRLSVDSTMRTTTPPSAPFCALLLATQASGFGGLNYLRRPTEDQTTGLAESLESGHAGTTNVYNMPVRATARHSHLAISPPQPHACHPRKQAAASWHAGYSLRMRAARMHPPSSPAPHSHARALLFLS
jgi:hypothetical protein